MAIPRENHNPLGARLRDNAFQFGYIRRKVAPGLETVLPRQKLNTGHNDIQISMLPEESPQMEGYSISATSYPAREVGGDFYDFIEMGIASLCEFELIKRLNIPNNALLKR